MLDLRSDHETSSVCGTDEGGRQGLSWALAMQEAHGEVH